MPCHKSLEPQNGNIKYSYKRIRFTHLWRTGKSEIRASKLETNTNVKISMAKTRNRCLMNYLFRILTIRISILYCFEVSV